MELVWPLINTVQGVFVALWTAFWILVALLASALARSRRPGLFLARRVWAPGILRAVFTRLGALGGENLDPSVPCFFAANHQSWIAGKVRVAIGEPIPTVGLRREDRAVLARRTQQAVEVLLAGLRNEPVSADAANASRDLAADRDGLLEA